MDTNTIGYGCVVVREDWYTHDKDSLSQQAFLICDTVDMANRIVEERTKKDLLEPISDDYRSRYFYQQLPIVSESPRKEYERVIRFLIGSLEEIVLGGEFDFDSTKDVVDLAFPNLIDEYFIP